MTLPDGSSAQDARGVSWGVDLLFSRAEREVEFGNTGQVTGFLGGFEATAELGRPFAQAKLWLRSGSFDPVRGTNETTADADVTDAGGQLAVGHRLVHAEVGFAKRALGAAFRDYGVRSWKYFSLGAGTRIPMVYGMSLDASAARYVGVTAGDETEGTGRRAEARIVWTPPLLSWPVRFHVGWRYEEFIAFADDEVGGDRSEQMSGVLLGVGLTF